MVATLSRELVELGFDVRVLVTRGRGALGDSLAADGIPVDCAGLRQDGADYMALRRLAAHIRAFRPQVVHTHAAHALLYGGAAAHLCRVPRKVHTEHGRVFPDRSHVMVAERWLSRGLVKYVTVSQALADAVHQHEHIPLRKIEVIPNGVADLPQQDDEAVAALRKRLVGERSGPVVGVAARLVWEKGLDVLLRAWAQQQLSSNWAGTLVIAGEGPERAKLESLIAELGLHDTVRLPGTLLNVAPFYRMLDAFVLSSVSEGLPMALLEAMAAGLPIIATRVGAMPEALANGLAGELVHPSDVDALAMQLRSVLAALSGERGDGERSAESRRWQAFGRAARMRFEAAYTAKAMVSSYMALYVPNVITI